MASAADASDGVGPALSGADADHFLDRQHEDLAVADAAGLGRFLDRGDDLADLLVGGDDLELDLGQEVDDVLGPSIELRMPLLAPEPLDLADGEALDAVGAQAL